MLITKNIYFDWQINPGLITMKQEPSFLYTTEMYDDEGFLAAPASRYAAGGRYGWFLESICSLKFKKGLR